MKEAKTGEKLLWIGRGHKRELTRLNFSNGFMSLMHEVISQVKNNFLLRSSPTKKGLKGI